MPLITLQTMLMLMAAPVLGQQRNLFDMYLRQTPPKMTQQLLFQDTGLTRQLPLTQPKDANNLWQNYPQAVRNLMMLKTLQEQGILEQQVLNDPFTTPLTTPVNQTNYQNLYPDAIAGPATPELPLKTPLEQVLTETIRQNVWNLMYPGLTRTVAGIQNQPETDGQDEAEALNMTVAKNTEEPLVGALDMEA